MSSFATDLTVYSTRKYYYQNPLASTAPNFLMFTLSFDR